MKPITFVTALMIFLAGLVFPVQAQESGLRVHLQKDFGYGWGNTIQGRFTISIVGDSSKIDRATFFIDEEVLGEADSEPFGFSFSTDDFSAGTHRFHAEVLLQDGSVWTTPSVSYRFLSSEEASQQLTKILMGVGGAVLVILLLMVAVQMVTIRRKPGREGAPSVPQNYGLLGGTICPKCGRAFTRHIWGFYLLVGRLDRCEHCGSWVMTKRAMPAELRSVEENQSREDQNTLHCRAPDPDRRDALEDTKFMDHL